MTSPSPLTSVEFKDGVLESYKNAIENDYLFEGYTLEDIAGDMMAFDPGLEDYLDVYSDEILVETIVSILKEVRPE